MRKTVQYNLLAAGIVILTYSVVMPFQEALVSYRTSFLLSYVSYRPSVPELFAVSWGMGYNWLTLIGGFLVLMAVLLLVIFRKSNSQLETMPAVLISSGMMLETTAFLQVWSASVEQAYIWNRFDLTLNSGYSNTLTEIPDGALELDIVDATAHSPWEYLLSSYEDQLWQVILGAVLIVIGIVAALVRKPKQEIPAEELPEEIPAETIVVREEAVIRLYCTVMDIRGDYALVKYDDTGIESEVAIALLPFGIDVGDKLKYENYEFTQI